MQYQVFTLLIVVAVASAAPGHIGYGAPVVSGVATYSVPTVAEVPAVAAVETAIVHTGANGRETYRAQDGFDNYAAGYSVSDALTGDFKSSHEQDIGGAKIGSFSLLDPNGYERRTDYVADAFGARQVITGSENGLYVNGPAHTIQPHGAPLVAATVSGHTTIAAAPVATYAAPAIASAPIATYAAPAIAEAPIASYAAPAFAAAPAIAEAPIASYGAPAFAAAPAIAEAPIASYAEPAIAAVPAVGPAVAAAHETTVETAVAAPVVVAAPAVAAAPAIAAGPALGYAGLGYGGLGFGYGGLGYGYGAFGHGYGAVGHGYGAVGHGYGAVGHGYGALDHGYGAVGHGYGGLGLGYGGVGHHKIL